MKNLIFAMFLFFSLSLNAQESQIDSTAKSKYERLKIGESVDIYMQVRGSKIGSLGAGYFDKNRKFNPKSDFKFSGTITDKLVVNDTDWFIKMKIEKMFLKNRKVKKMIILGEEMFIGTEALFNLSNLEIQ